MESEVTKTTSENWGIIIGLIGFFGTIISFLLGIIGVMLNRWVSTLEQRMDGQDEQIMELMVVSREHATEIKNLKEITKG